MQDRPHLHLKTPWSLCYQRIALEMHTHKKLGNAFILGHTFILRSIGWLPHAW